MLSNLEMGTSQVDSDNRFVMVEIGKLTAHVERLISDVKGMASEVKGLGEKVDDIKHQVSFVRGALWASAGFLTVLIAVVSFFLSSRWTDLETAVVALQKVTAASQDKK